MTDEIPKVKLLIVEDNEDDVVLLIRQLSRCVNMRFEETVTGKLSEATDLLRRQAFDVVLLDLQLLDSSRQQTILSLSSEVYSIPTIILSGEFSESEAMAAIKLGADDYLDKNKLSVSDLCAMIKKSIARHCRKMKPMKARQIRLEALLRQIR